MLLGVSRQAISKWESGKAYPEMDKLLMICDLFGCTLDDLVLGDVRAPRSVPDATPEPADGMGAAGFPEAEREICNGGLASDATSSNTSAKQSAAYGLSPNVSVGQQAVSVALPEDLTGYDAHMNSFAWKVAAGIAAIITGVAVGVLFDSEGTVFRPAGQKRVPHFRLHHHRGDHRSGIPDSGGHGAFGVRAQAPVH